MIARLLRALTNDLWAPDIRPSYWQEDTTPVRQPWEDEAEQAARKRYRTRMGRAVPAAERLAQTRNRASRGGTIRRNPRHTSPGWLFSVASATKLLARVAWPMERETNQASWRARLARDPELLSQEAARARTNLEQAIAALVRQTGVRTETPGPPD